MAILLIMLYWICNDCRNARSVMDVMDVMNLVFRFSVLHGQDSSEWSLRITGVQPRDSGEYQCQVSYR